MINSEQLDQILEIRSQVQTEFGDQGSCVLGYKMYINGKQYFNQPWQGSISCAVFYDRVKEYLIDEGIPSDKIYIDYGVID